MNESFQPEKLIWKLSPFSRAFEIQPVRTLIPYSLFIPLKKKEELIFDSTDLIHRFIFHFMSPNLCSLVLTRPLD
ncbi:hypothetical protein IC575_030335 [Cucumis melo]